METKKANILSSSLLVVLLAGHIFNLPIVVLTAVVLICASILVSKSFISTSLLFFFFPFSYIFAYKQYNLCIFMAVAYILRTVSKGKIYTKAFYTVLLLAYCFAFANYGLGNLKLGTMISPILISLLVFVCEETEPTDYVPMIDSFKNGFIISAIVGLFKDRIPSISRLFDLDFVNDSGAVDPNVLQRYFGLTYDPNFFTVVNCVLIAILLLTTERFTWKEYIQLLFLAVTGIMTFSKSYLLIMAFVIGVYLLKRSRNVGRNIVLFMGVIITFVVIENLTQLDLISVSISRLESSADSGDLTTGRLDLWKDYVIYIFKNIRVFCFGVGFNALALNVKAAHNTYIDFVYRFGMVGTVLWIIYFVMSYRTVYKKQNGISSLATNVPLLVCLFGFMFLSAFTFQQLWCCFCLSFFAMFIPEEEKKCLN